MKAGSGPMVGVSNSSLASFTGDFSEQFLILSSGRVVDVVNANTSGNQGTDLGAGGVADDTVTIEFVIPQSATASAVAFDFTFLSEEYPEYVGSSYNDFFSIKVDGVERALDTNGRIISVNNNFFDGTLTPTGTMFDGQTPPLQVVAPITKGKPTVTVTLSLGDQGDGIYDSAAFIKNLRVVEPQIVYLDFDGATFTYDGFLTSSVTLPTSGLNATQQTGIVTSLNSIYNDYLIEFTTTKPTQGEFSTIYVGGTTTNLPASIKGALGLQPGYTLLGLAESIDYGNKKKSDEAFVLSGGIKNAGGTTDIPLVTQVIAHEAGHILGLRHVGTATELMYPIAGASRTNIGGSAPLAEIKPAGVTAIGGTQDSHGELTRNLGLKSSTELIKKASFFDSIMKFFTFSLGASLPTLYNVKVGAVSSEGEVLATTVIGTVQSGSSIEFLTPATEDDKIVVVGSTTADGPYDVFVSPTGTASQFDLATQGEAGLFATFGMSVETLNALNLDVTVAQINGALNTIGQIKAGVVDATSLEATEGGDTLFGTAAADLMVGLGGSDFMYGGAGNDTIYGGADTDFLVGDEGDDLLYGGAGPDILFHGPGNDTFDGGDGIDYMTYDIATTAVTVDLLDQTKNAGSAQGDRFVSVEAFFLSAHNDRFIGTDTYQFVFARDGNDYIAAGTGGNIVFGEGGNDTIVSGALGDIIVLGAGNDTLVYNLNEVQQDQVLDFNPAEDKISLSATGFNLVGQTITAGVNFFSTTAAVGATYAADQSVLIYFSDSGLLYADTDGAGGLAPNLLAALTGTPALQAGNFTLF